MTEHKQVENEWRGLRAEVDVELAPLILALWKAGIFTTNSCQENFPGIAWIQFLTTHHAQRFLNRVAVYPDEGDMRLVNGRTYVGDVPFWETLYGRATGYAGEKGWEYALNPYNRGVEEEIVNDEVVETCIGPSDFDFFVSVRFPRADIPLILERMQAPTRCPSCTRFPELQAKLLSIGGTEVVAQGPEPHLDILLERGRVFGRKGRKRLRGDLHRCHQNAAKHYAKHHALGYGGTCEIMTGYALAEDGLWHQHSWLWDGWHVIETNTNPTRCFGVILTPDESEVFVFGKVVCRLPGARLRAA
jgi:hypothetical protein